MHWFSQLKDQDHEERTSPFSLMAALGAAFLFVSAAQAHFAGVCKPRDALLAMLEGYGEHKVAIALGPGAAIGYELFAAEAGSWTLLLTWPGGMSCIAAFGDAWHDTPREEGTAL